VLEERRAVAGAALPAVLSLRELERRLGLWKARYHVGQSPSTGHPAKAYADRPNCD
jgi:hypothetical protein